MASAHAGLARGADLLGVAAGFLLSPLARAGGGRRRIVVAGALRQGDRAVGGSGRLSARWLVAAVAVGIMLASCARGLDTDAVAAGSYATMAQLADQLGDRDGVVCVDASIGHVFMDVGVPDRVSLRIFTEGLAPDEMDAVVRDGASRAWESDVLISSLVVLAIDRGPDHHTSADDIVVSLRDVLPELEESSAEEDTADMDRLIDVLGERQPDLAAVVGRARPALRPCPPVD